VNARATKRSYVIPGLDIVNAKRDGMVKPVLDHVPSTHTARVVRIIANARTTRNVHP